MNRAIALALGLAGCTGSVSGPQTDAPLHIVYMSRGDGEIEPCG